jgi:type II secretory pathway pseudopilin PulG
MNQKPKNFKLIEIAVLIIVLGSVGATVVPPFTEASGEEKTISTMNILEYVRSQIALYRSQNSGQIPKWQDQEQVLKELQGRSGQENLQGIPANPFNLLSTVRMSSESDQGAGTHGWHYNTRTGEFHADDCKSHAQL